MRQLVFCTIVMGASLAWGQDQSITKAFLFDSYQDGVIVNHKGGKVPVLLNYSTREEKLYIKKGDHEMALEYELNIDTVYFGLRPFVFADDFFMELLINGDVSLYRRHQAKFIETGTSIGYGTKTQTGTTDSFRFAPREKKDVPEGFMLKESMVYYVHYQGTTVELKKWGNIFRLIPEVKPNLKKYIKQYSLNVNDDAFKAVLFCNQELMALSQ
ncbi:MAG: hypothetical protein JXQ90_10740 [Cyclobacteriaceae bacterium]